MMYKRALKRRNRWKHVEKVRLSVSLETVDNHRAPMPEFEDGDDDNILKEWRGS
jgi:hypothetical protein